MTIVTKHDLFMAFGTKLYGLHLSKSWTPQNVPVRSYESNV